MRLLNEVVEHALGHFEIGDDTILHGTDGHDVSGRAAQHLLGFLAHRQHFAVGLVDGHDGGFVHDDPLPLGIDQRVGSAEIDREIGREQTKQRSNVHVDPSRLRSSN